MRPGGPPRRVFRFRRRQAGAVGCAKSARPSNGGHGACSDVRTRQHRQTRLCPPYATVNFVKTNPPTVGCAKIGPGRQMVGTARATHSSLRRLRKLVCVCARVSTMRHAFTQPAAANFVKTNPTDVCATDVQVGRSPMQHTPAHCKALYFTMRRARNDASHTRLPALQVQKSRPSSSRKRASTMLCTSEAPSTSRAWRA